MKTRILVQTADLRSDSYLGWSLRKVSPWLAAAALAAGLPQSAQAENLAPYGTGLLGFQNEVDGSPGTEYYHAGQARDIIDGNPDTHVDNWSNGDDQGQGVSFVGVRWPTMRYEQITGLTLTIAAFWDGGWFGPNGASPGAGEALTPDHLAEPAVQVSTNGGSSWVTVPSTSDYLTALTGATIGGGSNPNPTPLIANFTLTPGMTNISAIRLIGRNGGPADGNGFIGVYELAVEGVSLDSDADGLPDAWERANGLKVGVNDATEDPDADGLPNVQELQQGTDPQVADSDKDGLNDGEEVNSSLTSPVKADTDGDGLNDGPEITTHHTDPLLVDTDGDGLTDGQEVSTHHTDPLLMDTDNDGFSDGVEIALGSNPTDPRSIPGNLALEGEGLLGTQDQAGVDYAFFNSGIATNLNDGKFNTRVDTYNGGGTSPRSYVGILWGAPQTNPIVRMEVTFATFLDGGWFGPNNKGPGAGKALTSAYLTEPAVQVSADGGVTWTNVPSTSDYMVALNGHRIGGGGVVNPSSVKATFTLSKPVTGITALRVLGSEGGTASGGFLGVFEVAVYAKSDTDKDNMDDDWERQHGLVVGVNDANLDPDSDALANAQEYQAGSDPQKADTDGDTLKDGEEVTVYHTKPTSPDTDADGLSDSAELITHRTNPLAVDTDGDYFWDGLELTLGTDPLRSQSLPANLARRNDASAILGTEDAPGGLDTFVYNAGVAANINDGSPTTRVDDWNGAGTDPLSFVGILWTQPLTTPVARLELNLATFFDGGWFGINNSSPGASGLLTTNEYLVEPTVQVTKDGGITWTSVEFTSDYLTVLDGHQLPVAFGAPTQATVHFELKTPAADIKGIRIIGTEGGTASAGFLGVFELAALANVASPVKLKNVEWSAGEFRFAFDSQPGATHVVQFKASLAETTWQTLTTVNGDGTVKTVRDSAGVAPRFYRVSTE